MHASRYTVSDVMTHTVVAVSRDATFKKIVEAMDEWKVSAVPVLGATAESSVSSRRPIFYRRKSSVTPSPPCLSPRPLRTRRPLPPG